MPNQNRCGKRCQVNGMSQPDGSHVANCSVGTMSVLFRQPFNILEDVFFSIFASRINSGYHSFVITKNVRVAVQQLGEPR